MGLWGRHLGTTGSRQRDTQKGFQALQRVADKQGVAHQGAYRGSLTGEKLTCRSLQGPTRTCDIIHENNVPFVKIKVGQMNMNSPISQSFFVCNHMFESQGFCNGAQPLLRFLIRADQ